ncbi:AbrB/MazE/SpoVT family DNA-binding domain-containing protein [Halocatena salina]|uniref:AbrB/MazE/SpoVT family DNA-binding domain-containing protein n=1 Tax=Halocatena salina TaxID=2934340 RepID=UPI003F63BE6B
MVVSKLVQGSFPWRRDDFARFSRSRIEQWYGHPFRYPVNREQRGVTTPKSVRERSDLTPGDYVDIDVEGGFVVLRPRVSRE